jgi:hypothetical protein
MRVVKNYWGRFDPSISVGNSTADAIVEAFWDLWLVILKEKPNGRRRAMTCVRAANRAEVPMKASHAAIAAEGRARVPYVDCQACS